MCTRIAARCFAVTLSVFVGTELRAEPMLLLEIHQMGSSSNLSFIGQPLYMAFVVHSMPGQISVGPAGAYDPDDVGMTFNATPEQVDAVEFHLSQPTGRFILDISSFAARTHLADELWRTNWDPQSSDINVQQFVPRFGLGLTGFDLTAVTQTVDRIEYFMLGRDINSQQEQTIRIYGQPIPEPASVFLAVLHSLVCCATYGRYGRVRGFID